MRSSRIAKEHIENKYTVTDQNLEFVFSPPCYHDHPCHRQLDIAIHAPPSLHHSYPKAAQFPIISTFWGFESINVCHPWQRVTDYRVVAGSVIMKDCIEKTVEAFTFGGNLIIETKNECTMCSLISPAPILPLDIRPSISTLLADEVENILAERRGAWDEEHPRTAFEEHLAEIDPFILYISCLDVLRDKYSLIPDPYSENLHKFTYFLRTEIQVFRENGLWPIYLPSIEKLL